MKILTTVGEMQAACRALRRTGTLGLVPTMGALHDGHLSLVRRAKAENDAVAVSIFVNPTQFAPGEDFETYPRRMAEDCAKLEAAGVTLLFAPNVEQMYPQGATTFVEVAEVGDRLDGASRPGHFRGVATVVAKLFHVVDPDRAYFGQKDAAQVAVLRAMVRDLLFAVELVVCPIVREPSGLAMSSRNLKLSAAEKQRATALYRALEAAERALEGGETSAAALRAAMLSQLAGAEDVRLDYAEVVHPATLLPVADTRGGALIAVAAWVGQTRLIDNLLVEARAAAFGKTSRRAEKMEAMHA
ncbi:MAG: pantoate--beta-alanine ligase [Acidobacteriaceae bacterium]